MRQRKLKKELAGYTVPDFGPEGLENTLEAVKTSCIRSGSGWQRDSFFWTSCVLSEWEPGRERQASRF